MGQNRASPTKNPERMDESTDEKAFMTPEKNVNSLEVSVSSSISPEIMANQVSNAMDAIATASLTELPRVDDGKQRGKNDSNSSLEKEDVVINNIIDTTVTDLDLSQVSSRKSSSKRSSSSRSRDEKRSRSNNRRSERSESSRSRRSRPNSAAKSNSSQTNLNQRLRDLPENKSDNSDYYTITLNKGPNGYGLNITGGIDQPYLPNDNGIFITKIKRKGAAKQQGQLAKGDKIISMNGHSLEGITHLQALELFQKAGDRAEIVFLPHAEQLLRNQNIQKENNHGLFWDMKTKKGRYKCLRFVFWTAVFPVGSYMMLRRSGVISKRCRLLVPLKTVPGILAASAFNGFSSSNDYVRMRFMEALQKFRNL